MVDTVCNDGRSIKANHILVKIDPFYVPLFVKCVSTIHCSEIKKK